MKFVIQVWPKIYRAINGTFYFLLSLIKGIVVYAVRQIRGDV